MTAPTAELSSLATALDELSTRVTTIADRLSGTADDGLAVELYEVERALDAARRRLARILDTQR